jgi:uncharacterized protein (TIGR02757 family)
MIAKKQLKILLEDIYKKFNQQKYIQPDPLEFLYPFKDLREREIIGLIASALAYGRVAQINRSVSCVLDKMGVSPHDFILNSNAENLFETYDGFVHRFAATRHLVGLLIGVKNVLLKYGSIYECFLDGMMPGDKTVFPAVNHLAGTLISMAPFSPGHLVALPERGSAGKRLNLFLRWMVRKDSVDPGGWEKVSPSKLIIPLDVHIHRLGAAMGFTRKKQANLKTALEITDCFKKICPDDPVKYDFALTRLGIRKDCESTAAFISLFQEGISPA